MDKAKIRIGRFEESNIAYHVKPSEMYKFDKETKTLTVSNNNRIDGKVAQTDIYIIESGHWCTALLSGYRKGNYQTIDQKTKQ